MGEQVHHRQHGVYTYTTILPQFYLGSEGADIGKATAERRGAIEETVGGRREVLSATERMERRHFV